MESESTLEKVQKQDRERGALLQSLKQEKASLQVSDGLILLLWFGLLSLLLAILRTG